METMLLPNKLVAVLVLIAIGLLAAQGQTWPARDFQGQGRAFVVSGGTLLGLAVIGLAWAGADVVLAQHSAQARSPLLHSTLPAGLVAASLGLLAQLESTQAKIVGVLSTCGLMALILLAERRDSDMPGRWRTAAVLFLRLMTYLVSTLLFFAIRSSTSSPWLSAVAVAASSALLGLRLVGQEVVVPEPTISGPNIAVRLMEKLARHGWLRAAVLGALLGVTGWFVGHWPASPLAYSLTLMVALYILAGVSADLVSGRFTRQSALEYLIVGSVVVVLLVRYAR